MRFRWTKPDAERAVVTMAFARVKCRSLSVEDAVRATLATGHHCRHPEAISAGAFRRICKAVEDKLSHGVGGSRTKRREGCG